MQQQYCVSPLQYHRLPTREVRVGNLIIGNGNPIRIQTMTTTDTMDTATTVAQTIRCIKAGAELVRITAPSKNEAENLLLIKQELQSRGYTTPLVADIHFTPNAAEIAARIVEKVRVNPGNYVDKKKFDLLEYTDAEYAAEIDNIRKRFSPLVRICREHGTAMRIGTNHGSLSDRIMSRYGDTPIGMVESAMEFLRIARDEDYHQIILSMKSSNPLVMVQAYRLLVQQMSLEFGECYPLHLGVTEAGDGEDGRIKSAIGIGTLLEDGIGDTIRVSLTEDPEFEIPVCKDIVARYNNRTQPATVPDRITLPYSPYEYQRRATVSTGKTGGVQVPVVVADLSNVSEITPADLQTFGYQYHEPTDKWNIGDGAADFVYTGNQQIGFPLPGTLQVVCTCRFWQQQTTKNSLIPLLSLDEVADAPDVPYWLQVDAASFNSETVARIAPLEQVTLILKDSEQGGLHHIRRAMLLLAEQGCKLPVILHIESNAPTVDEELIHFSTLAGGTLLDGMGDGLWLGNPEAKITNMQISGRTYLPLTSNMQFLNNTAFSILQATRTRISKTEYISCPSCGRTLFELQETTARIRNATQHLKGLKIAVMGCIVNGPGEMADADFGYVGSGPGKITLYKGKEVMKRGVPSDTAVEELIGLIREHGAWIDPLPTLG